MLTIQNDFISIDHTAFFKSIDFCLVPLKDLRTEALALKELVADLSLENRLLKKNMTGAGGDHA